MRLMGRKIGEYIGLREILIVLAMMVAAVCATLIEATIPPFVSPILILCIIGGLLYGPYACAAFSIVSTASCFMLGSALEDTALNLLNIIVITMTPYRLWYSTDMVKDDRPPVLDSVSNVVKYVVVIATTSLVYSILCNITTAVALGPHGLTIMDITTFFNAMSFSMMIGLSAILILRYFGFRFYTPKLGGTPDGYRRSLDRRWFYIFLLIAIIAPTWYLSSNDDPSVIPITAVCTYLLMLMFLAIPVEHSTSTEKTKVIWGLTVNTFNASLIERMIALLLIYGVAVCAATVIGTMVGILSPIFDLTDSQATTFYMSVVLAGFFLPSIAFLWYLENNVTVPIQTMSSAARNFIDDEYGDSGVEFKRRCMPITDKDTEVGELAKSLTKMTDDIEEYIYDIKSLNSAQEKYKAELDVAQNIQESFIPRNFDSMDGTGLSIAGSMDAARYVGGDFYDFFMVDADHVALAIGDVSGKGVPAALFMAVTKSIIESQTRPGLEPNEIMAKVNINLCRNNDENMFVTSWLGIVELSTGNLRYCSAGHNPPVLVRADAPAEMVESKPSLVLGAKEGVQYTTFQIDMSVGDSILLYTDGVTEANDGYQEFYGTDRLKAMLDAHKGEPLEEQVGLIRQDIAEFTHHAEQFDDITMLLFRYDGKTADRSAQQ